MTHTRQETHITQASASRMVEAAVAHALGEGLSICVAVVDRAGRLKAFAQMDGAPAVAEQGSVSKARTALLGLPSGVLASQFQDDITALVSYVGFADTALLGGGFPIVLDGEIVGAIGVGGAMATEQDEACANAGLSILDKKH